MRRLLMILTVLFLLVLAAPVVRAQSQQYVVQPGDTLDAIGRRYNLNVACLAVRNNITNPNRIYRGQVITLDSTCPAYGAPFGTGGPGRATYIVQPGDYMNLIARRFNLDLACLITRNGLPNANVIRPGQQLIIDYSCPAYSGFTLPATGGPVINPPASSFPYTVQRGDSLGRIGQALNYDPYCIARVNGISNPNLIYPGQVLTISTACPRLR